MSIEVERNVKKIDITISREGKEVVITPVISKSINESINGGTP
jgi:virulence-associated protein VagC